MTRRPELPGKPGAGSEERDEEQRNDNSLRGKAMRRAASGEVPTTLTPWEWQEWYEAHGMPRAFRGAEDERSGRPGLWERIVAGLRRR